MPADARAAVVSLATLSPGTRGFVVAHPCGIPAPGTSSLNFDADDPIAALSVSALGAGSLCITSFSRTHLIVDLLGVWVPTPDAPPPTTGPGPATEDPDAMDPPTSPDLDAGWLASDAGSTTLDADLSAHVDAGGPGALSGTCSCRIAARPRGPRARVEIAAAALLLALAAIARRARTRRRAR